MEMSDEVDDVGEQEVEVVQKRTRIARSRSAVDVNKEKEERKKKEEEVVVEEPRPTHVQRYKCPTCHKLLEKPVGLFAHMRKMEACKKESGTVDAESLRITLEADYEQQLKVDQNTNYPYMPLADVARLAPPPVPVKQEAVPNVRITLNPEPEVKKELKLKITFKK